MNRRGQMHGCPQSNVTNSQLQKRQLAARELGEDASETRGRFATKPSSLFDQHEIEATWVDGVQQALCRGRAGSTRFLVCRWLKDHTLPRDTASEAFRFFI